MDKILYNGKELFSPKSDIVFKELFGKEDSKEILRYLLNDMLDLNIKSAEDITLLNTEVVPETPEEKLSRLDICAIVTNDRKERINIEVQVQKDDDMMKRSVYYVAKLFSNQLAKSGRYQDLAPTIGLSILDYNIFDDDRFMHRGRFKDIETGYEFTDCIELKKRAWGEKSE